MTRVRELLEELQRLTEGDVERRSAERAAQTGGTAEAVREFVQQMRTSPVTKEKLAHEFFRAHHADVTRAAAQFLERLARPIVAEQHRALEPAAIERGTGLEGIGKNTHVTWGPRAPHPNVRVSGKESHPRFYLDLPPGRIQITNEDLPSEKLFKIFHHVESTFEHLLERLNAASASLGGKWEPNNARLNADGDYNAARTAGRSAKELNVVWDFEYQHEATPGFMLAIASSI